MVDQLNAFASEVTRVAREVGTEGKLGGQAQVPGVGGTWKDLTDTVNVMAANLTEQVRGIVKVVNRRGGRQSQAEPVRAVEGRSRALADTINDMTKTLAIFADQVTSVAREVGVEGRLGGQANVPGAAGTWKDLTGNVNLLAANLTNQVRAIAEVATAVTKGDLTRSIQVEARGEVADLKDNINTMIDNLRLTTDRNTEQDWLKTNLARFTGMLQGQRDLATVGKMLLSELAPLVNAHQGLMYQMSDDGGASLRLLASYANADHAPYPPLLRVGEGFIGQCALDHRRIILNDVPANTVTVGPVFFNALPRSLAVFPVVFEGNIKAVLALASLNEFAPSHLGFLEQLTANLGIVLNSIEVTMQTEALLKQSQQLAVSCRPSRRSCSRPTISWARKRSSWPSRTPRSSARIAKSSRRGGRWRRKRPSLR
jgi:HAMP domain-containing protein